MEHPVNTPPRLVVDVSAWPADRELFEQLHLRALRGPLQPVALVLLESQAALLPPHHDELRTLQLCRVINAAEGVLATVELAGASAMVLAPWQFDPAWRWLAGEYHDGVLTLVPDDGLALFAELGALPAHSPPTHPLDDICEPAGVKFSNVESLPPARRRWWMYTLASEPHTAAMLAAYDGLRQPAMRLAFAHQLGIAATSTAHERLEHELDLLSAGIRAALGIPIEVLDPAAHAERLAQAAQRPLPASAWRCGDEIHLLHGEPTLEHPRLVVHHPAQATPALTRLLRHMADWSACDHELDPSLAHAAQALDPEGNERSAFLHARAAIQWNNLRPEPRSAPWCDRWADELRAVLAHDPPPAALRLRLPEGDTLSFAGDDRLAETLRAHELLARPRGHRTLLADRNQVVLRLGGAPEAAVVYIDNSSPYSVEIQGSRNYCRARIFADPEQAEDAAIDIPAVWLPVLAAARPDVDLWLDCVERSSALHGWTWEQSRFCEKLLRTTERTRIELLRPTRCKADALKLEPAIWAEADLLLAQSWLALRAALKRPNATRIATGVICSLTSGVSAHLAIHTRRDDAPHNLVAAFDATVEGLQARLEMRTVWTHAASVAGQVADIGVRVPAQMTLLTPTFAASVTFVATPLLQSGAGPVIGPVVAAQIAAQKPRG